MSIVRRWKSEARIDLLALTATASDNKVCHGKQRQVARTDSHLPRIGVTWIRPPRARTARRTRRAGFIGRRQRTRMTAIISLGTFVRVPLLEAWPTEDGNFTPWLAGAQAIALLGFGARHGARG